MNNLELANEIEAIDTLVTGGTPSCGIGKKADTVLTHAAKIVRDFDMLAPMVRLVIDMVVELRDSIPHDSELNDRIYRKLSEISIAIHGLERKVRGFPDGCNDGGERAGAK